MRPSSAQAWRYAAQVFALQVVLGAVLAALLWTSGATGAVAILVPLLASVLGAWGWAARVGRSREHLERPWVRAIAARQGALVGPIVGMAWASAAAQPGQVEVAGTALLGVATLLSIGAGATGAGLTLCGLDLGRAGE